MSQTFKLLDTHVECSLPGGIVKAISFSDFKAVIESVVSDSSEEPNLFLPSNCFVFSKSSTDIKLSCYYPGEKREVQYVKTRGGSASKMTIPFPNMIINFDLKNDNNRWVVANAQYLSTHKRLSQLPLKRPKEGDEGVWIAPLPNTFGGGRMCYGNNSMPSGFTDNLRGLDWYFQFLFATPFNSDLSINSLKSSFSTSAWMEFLSECDEFPYDMLSGYNP